MTFKSQIEAYRKQHAAPTKPLRAVLFDMDGVLFDSMPNHAKSCQDSYVPNGRAKTFVHYLLLPQWLILHA